MEHETEKTAAALSLRLKEIYKKLPAKFRQHFIEDFAKTHGISERTVVGKISGRFVTEWELRWAECYNPYTRSSRTADMISPSFQIP